MKLLAGLAAGITLSILAHILGWPLIGWLLIRIPPATHPDCKPRFRSWHHGVEIS